MSIHCVAHRFALAITEAADKVSPIKQFSIHFLCTFISLLSVLVNFRLALSNSFLQTLNLRQPSGTHWLACDEAVQILKCSFELLTKKLEDIANSDDGDATAVGLAVILQRYKFVSCVLFKAEVLPILRRLSKCFQTKNLSFTSSSDMCQKYTTWC